MSTHDVPIVVFVALLTCLLAFLWWLHWHDPKYKAYNSSEHDKKVYCSKCVFFNHDEYDNYYKRSSGPDLVGMTHLLRCTHDQNMTRYIKSEPIAPIERKVYKRNPTEINVDNDCNWYKPKVDSSVKEGEA